jgi:uncharacterized membrane protein
MGNGYLEGDIGMDEEDDEAEDRMSALSTFKTYLLLTVLVISPIPVLIFYFSDILKDDPLTYTRGIRMLIGFALGCLLSLIISGFMTWRAVREPVGEEGEEEDEEEEEEEEEDEEEDDD